MLQGKKKWHQIKDAEVVGGWHNSSNGYSQMVLVSGNEYEKMTGEKNGNNKTISLSHSLCLFLFASINLHFSHLKMLR